MSLNDINQSVIMKALGLSVDADEIKSVTIPKEIVEQANEKMNEYHKIMNKNKHASAKNKIRNILHKDENSDEKNRKKALDEIMFKTRLWMLEAEEYFKGCSGADVLEKFSKEIETDFKNLQDKGYLKESLNSKPSDYTHLQKKDYELIYPYNSELTHLRNCHLVYSSICRRFEVLLKDKIEKDGQIRESLDEIFKQKRKAAKNDLQGKNILINEFKAIKKQLLEYCAAFDDAKIKFMDYIGTIDAKSPIIRQKVSKTMESVDDLERKKKEVLRNMGERRLDIYFHIDNKSINNNLLQAFRGFVIGLNDLYKNLTFGYKLKATFSKVITEKFTALNEELTKTLPNTVNEFKNAALNNNNISKRSEEIRISTEKIIKQSEKIEKATKEIDLCQKEVNTKYDAWKKEQQTKKIRIGALAIFAFLGGFNALFTAFFPLFDAATNPEFAPVNVAPQ